MALALAFSTRFPRPGEGSFDTSRAFGWCLLATTILLGAHITAVAMGTREVDRAFEITRYSAYISLENLLWPLLLQFINSSGSARIKLMYLSLLLPVISLSPYRGSLFAVVVFGLGLPVIAGMAKQKSHWKTLFMQRKIIIGGVLGGLAAVLFVYSMYADTRNRLTENELAQSQSEVRVRLTQRLAVPLFQAYFAERMAIQEPLPTVWDEILRKFRIGRGQNLNEYLFDKVYGKGTISEMTSLYYGEASANSMSHPIIWIVIGPFLLVAIWLALGRAGYDASTVVGIAIWRGSLGGVASVIPALLLQILAIMVLTRRNKRKTE